MVGLGKSISHVKASLEYGNDVDKKSQLVHRELIIGDTPLEIANEFKMVQSLNKDCPNNMFSFVLSPTIDDAKELEENTWNQIAKDFIEDLGFTGHQSIGFVHNDKKHRHMHLYVNRIDFDGRAKSDSFIGKKSMKAAERVAIKNNLTTLTELREKREKPTKKIRAEIYSLHENVLANLNSKSIEHYIIAMKEKAIMIIPSVDKLGNLRGFRVEYEGHSFKGSEVHRSMSKMNLYKALESITPKQINQKSINDDTVRETIGPSHQ